MHLDTVRFLEVQVLQVFTPSSRWPSWPWSGPACVQMAPWISSFGFSLRLRWCCRWFSSSSLLRCRRLWSPAAHFSWQTPCSAPLPEPPFKAVPPRDGQFQQHNLLGGLWDQDDVHLPVPFMLRGRADGGFLVGFHWQNELLKNYFVLFELNLDSFHNRSYNILIMSCCFDNKGPNSQSVRFHFVFFCLFLRTWIIFFCTQSTSKYMFLI